MKRIKLILLFVLCVCRGFSQEVKGSLKDQEGKNIANATVSLLRVKDSGVVKIAISDQQGMFKLQTPKAGRYIVSAAYVGYNSSVSNAFDLGSGSGIQLEPLILTRKNSTLNNVTVKSSKPMVEVKADKTIMNVEGTMNAVGTDALELLRKAPGVVVDKDDNMTMNGKNGVQVYIDGRPTPLSGADLANYLKTVQSAQIEAVELITNPSAKYEAAGNAGIINIRLKKDKSLGTNGSVNAGYLIGIYPKYNGGFSLNNRSRKVNIYGTYNHNAVKAVSNSANYRTVLDTLFDQHNTVNVRVRGDNLKAGLDYYIDKKQTIGIIINGNHGENTVVTTAATPISYIPTSVVDRILSAGGNNLSKRNSVTTNLNYSLIDGSKKSLLLNADYGFFQIDGDQLQPNIYLDASGKNEISRIIYNMISPSRISLYSLKADYEQDYRKGKLAFGAKSSWVRTDNDFQRFDVFTNSKSLDKERSNNFSYRENINAAYINYNKSVKKWTLQLGLRAEQTISEGRSKGQKANNGGFVPYDSVFKNNYTDIFPSAAISYSKDPMHQWTLNYSARVDRPIYQDLNPFEFKIDEYTFGKGNTRLRPQYTNSVGVTFLYKQRLNTSVNYSRVDDIFAQLLDTSQRSKIVQSKQNLATQDIVSLNISYPIRYKNFNAFINTSSYYSKYKADFGPGRKIDIDAFATRIAFQSSLRFKKLWTADLSANYTSPSIIQGTFKASGFGAVDAGFQRTVLKNAGTVRVGMSDIFHTMKVTATSSFAGQYVRSRSVGDTRVLRITFNYRFGSAMVKAARQRKTGLEEEAGRVQ